MIFFPFLSFHFFLLHASQSSPTVPAFTQISGNLRAELTVPQSPLLSSPRGRFPALRGPTPAGRLLAPVQRPQGPLSARLFRARTRTWTSTSRPEGLRRRLPHFFSGEVALVRLCARQEVSIFFLIQNLGVWAENSDKFLLLFFLLLKSWFQG